MDRVVFVSGVQPTAACELRDIVEAVPADPLDLVVIERADRPVESRTEYLVPRAFVAVVAAIEQIAEFQAEFLADFASRRRFGRLTDLDASTRQSPAAAGERQIAVVHGQQEPIAGPQNAARGFVFDPHRARHQRSPRPTRA